MSSSLRSLIECGTKLWLDSIDPDLVQGHRDLGGTGATSNPIIVADLIKTGRFDTKIAALFERGLDDEAVAWAMTDDLVGAAQEVFAPVWRDTNGNDGYVSFEVDPLLEDPQQSLSHEQRVKRYLELGQRWSAGHTNRMIKVPATHAGLASLSSLAAAGLTLNVTLIFTLRQYRAAREAIWAGARHRGRLDRFKSVYSIFVSRVDVYTRQHVPELSPSAQGWVGLVNAKRMWLDNQRFWADKSLPLQQEIIFASTGAKDPHDPPDKYVAALAGSDIQTNPPATNEAVKAGGKHYRRTVDQMPPDAVLTEIDRMVDMAHLEETLMREGIQKFADPHKNLLTLIAQKRQTLAITR